MNLEIYLKIAVNAALEAGAKIMEIYDSVVEVKYKEDKSPLTQADKEANTIINNYLIPTEIPIISEENKQIDFETRKQWRFCWIVDPLDGTKEFIKRNGEFTINIALVDNRKPVLGVIYVPVLKELYFGDTVDKTVFKAILSKHQNSFESIMKKKTKIGPKQRTDLIQVVGSRSHMSEETLDYIKSIKKEGKTVEVVSKGSSLKFCLLAEGLADVYPRFAPTMEWDTAAGQAICESVGLEVISNETNLPLLYNKENLLNPWFIVKNQ